MTTYLERLRAKELTNVKVKRLAPEHEFKRADSDRIMDKTSPVERKSS